MTRNLRSVLCFVWLALLSGFVMCSLSACPFTWSTYSSINPGSLYSSFGLKVVRNTDPIPIQVIGSYDLDKCTSVQDPTKPYYGYDDLTYSFGASGGTLTSNYLDRATNGWRSENAGTYTIWCDISDGVDGSNDTGVSSPDTGNRNDTDPDRLSITIEALDYENDLTIHDEYGSFGPYLRFKVRTRGTGFAFNSIRIKENTTEHATEWYEYNPEYPRMYIESSSTDSDLITTTIYKWDWNHSGFHNGTHNVEVQGTFNRNDGTTVPKTINTSVQVKNTVITEVDPPNVIFYNGETHSTPPITVKYENYNPNSLFSVGASLERTYGEWQTAGPAVPGQASVPATSTTLQVTSGGSSASGVYSPIVTVSSEGSDRNRSYAIGINRIWGSELTYVPEGETGYYPVEYWIDSTKDASEGVLRLYNEDLTEEVVSWNVEDMECVNHGLEKDGLKEDVTGWHKLKVRVPDLDPCQTYHFVLSMKDDFALEYKDHKAKWAIDQCWYIKGVPEISLVDTPSHIGGKYPLRIRVKTSQNCEDYMAGFHPLSFEEREYNDTLDPQHIGEWTSLNFEGNNLHEVMRTSDGEHTTIDYTIPWDTTKVHDGKHKLHISLPGHSGRDVSEEFEVNVMNLSVAVNPVDHITWDGEEVSDPITVSVQDNDTNDPVDISLNIYDCAGGPTLTRTITISGVTRDPEQSASACSATFAWDGKDNYGFDANPGAYTYDVNVSQQDSNSSGIAGESNYTVADQATYRSTYLALQRAHDASNQPIYDVTCDGIDDKGTPDAADDDIIYIVRFYSLVDSGSKNASDGELTLYDPDMVQLMKWPHLAGVEEQAEVNPPFYEASQTGVWHKLRVPVSQGLMQFAGDYRFVLHLKDDHILDYRDHRKRSPLDLNSKEKIVGAAFVCVTHNDDPSSGDNIDFSTFAGNAAFCTKNLWDAKAGHFVIGYAGWKPVGDPGNGGSGLIYDKPVRDVIRTLGRICPTQPQNLVLHPNAVWAYFGHAVPHALIFGKAEIGQEIANNLVSNGVPADLPGDQCYTIMKSNLQCIKLAYLLGCGTAGGAGNTGDDTVYNCPKGDSIAASFNARGAHTVVGYFNKAFNSPLYKGWNLNFWRAMQRGVGVIDAVRYANNIGGFNLLDLGVPKPDVRVFGDYATKLVPPAYGN